MKEVKVNFAKPKFIDVWPMWNLVYESLYWGDHWINTPKFYVKNAYTYRFCLTQAIFSIKNKSKNETQRYCNEYAKILSLKDKHNKEVINVLSMCRKAKNVLDIFWVIFIGFPPTTNMNKTRYENRCFKAYYYYWQICWNKYFFAICTIKDAYVFEKHVICINVGTLPKTHIWNA